MTSAFDSVFIAATGKFMPGAPVGSEHMDEFIVPLGARATRLERILADNGIRTRHYAIEQNAATVFRSANGDAGGACVARDQ